MGAQTAVDPSALRWLTPLPLWTGILAGPIAWAFDLTASYASVKWVCHTRTYGILPLITLASLAVVGVAAIISWKALRCTADDVPTDGGRPRQRAQHAAVNSGHEQIHDSGSVTAPTPASMHDAPPEKRRGSKKTEVLNDVDRLAVECRVVQRRNVPDPQRDPIKEEC